MVGGDAPIILFPCQDHLQTRAVWRSIRTCRAASPVSLEWTIVVSSVVFYTFLRRDVVGATCLEYGPATKRSTIATTDGRGAGFGSVCSSRLQLLAMFLTNSASTVSHVKAHRSAAGAKGGSGRRRSGARAAVAPRKSIVWPMIAADRSPSC